MAAVPRPIRKNPAFVYKLTDENMQTYLGYQWILGRTQKTTGQGDLCSSGWLHAYSDPIIGEMLNSMHAAFPPDTLRVFRAIPSGVYLSDGNLKVGVSELTLITELPRHNPSLLERAAWAIFVVRAIPKRRLIPEWEDFADSLLAHRFVNQVEAGRAAWAAGRAAGVPAAKASAWAAGRAAGVPAAKASRAAAWAAGAAARAAAAAASKAAGRAARSAAEAAETAETAETATSLLTPTNQYRNWVGR